MKKFSLVALVATLLVGFVIYTPANANMPFTDVTNKNKEDEEFYNAVSELAAEDIVFGVTETAFKPNQQATRGETAEMIVRALGWENETFKTPSFSDVSTSHKYYKSIAILADKGIIDSGGKFRPEGALTRANIAKIITKAFELDEVTSTKTPFKDISKVAIETQRYIATLVKYEVTIGSTSDRFNPNGKMTRKHLALFIHRGLKHVDSGEFEIIGID